MSINNYTYSVHFGLMLNSKGDKTSNTQWHNIIAWGKVADRIEAEFKKGSFVTVDGRLVSRSYTDKNGQKRYITEIVVHDAELVQKQA